MTRTTERAIEIISANAVERGVPDWADLEFRTQIGRCPRIVLLIEAIVLAIREERIEELGA